MKEIQKYVMSTTTQLMKKQNAHIFLVFCRIETFHILVVTFDLTKKSICSTNKRPIMHLFSGS